MAEKKENSLGSIATGIASTVTNAANNAKKKADQAKAAVDKKKTENSNQLAADTTSPSSTPSSTSSKKSSSGSSGSSGGSAADSKKKAKKNQIELSNFDADSTITQYNQSIANYDKSNEYNRELADKERVQNSRKTEIDRFNAMRDLQNAALGLFGSLGQAGNSSTVGNLMSMLENRNDRDNTTYWAQHQVNQDAVENAYEESYNQNAIAKEDARIDTIKALRDQESALAASLNNIDPDMYVTPGTGKADLGSAKMMQDGVSSAVTGDIASAIGKSGYMPTAARYSTSGNADVAASRTSVAPKGISEYLMPDNSVQAARAIAPRNKLLGNDYFSRMINRYNGR